MFPTLSIKFLKAFWSERYTVEAAYPNVIILGRQTKSDNIVNKMTTITSDLYSVTLDK